MKWEDLLDLVENMPRLGGYTIIEFNESIKDIVILSSQVAGLKRVVRDLWEVKVVKTDYIDKTNEKDYLVKVRINNRVGDLISMVEVVGIGIIGNDELEYLKNNRDEFNKFIRYRKEKSKYTNTLESLEQLVCSDLDK